MSEHLENMRRMAERGLMRAQQHPMQSQFIDMFQHIIDEHSRAKTFSELQLARIDELEKTIESGDKNE